MKTCLVVMTLLAVLLCQAACGAALTAPLVSLVDLYHDPWDGYTQYSYRVEGQSDSYIVDAFEIYAPYNPTELVAIVASGFDWTGSVANDGYGGAKVRWQANTEDARLFKGSWLRVGISINTYTATDENYKWPGFAGQTNWGYEKLYDGGAISEGMGCIAVPCQVPEPATLATVLLGCTGFLARRRR